MLSLFAAIAFSSSTSVYVMAPLDILTSDQKVNYPDKLGKWLDQLKNIKVDGIMCDIWWGLVEKTAKNYKFDGYATIFNMFKTRGLKIIPVLSFHQCGGNVGDTCNFMLPSFVTGSKEQPFYVDADGNVDQEYISLAYDNVKVGDRTPADMYKDFMSAFKSQFSSLISQGTITEIEIGLGPAGELRYPSYQLKYWSYPGCGEFQSYDAQMKAQVASAASSAGKSSYGHPPTNAGNYNVQPGGSAFWTDSSSDGWKSDYGQWFIKWYSKQLIVHAQNILKNARAAFGSNTHLSAKIAGLHWWYDTSCHCTENAAGFNNFPFYNGYRDIVSAFKMYNVDVCFTCLEMTKGSYSSDSPALIQQVLDAAKWAGVGFEGENALPCYDTSSFYRIRQWAKAGLTTFTYLRLCDDLMSSTNLATFAQLVSDLHNGA